MALAELLRGRNKTHLARSLGVHAPSVFQWVARGTFPPKYLPGIAAWLGTDERAIAHLVHGRPPYQRMVATEAYPAIERAYRAGQTLAEIGKVYGVTRERIRQLLVGSGANAKSGGAFVRKLIKRARKEALINARYVAKHGMTRAEYMALRGDNFRTSPQLRYRYQERTAHHRGIGWEFNFASWWKVWSDSGKWALRGRGHGYVMSRIGDAGPYSPENVRIIKATENVAEYYDRERATYGRVRSGQERKAA